VTRPLSGNTHQAFVDLASKAPPSTIPPQAPLGGTLSVNGTVVRTMKGNVLDATALGEDMIYHIPKPGDNDDQYLMDGQAGGGRIGNYNWGDNISSNATDFLQLIQFLDNILLTLLVGGTQKLNQGPWKTIYPKSIVKTIGSMTAQAYIHRGTATDSLQHYSKPLMQVCKYKLPDGDIDDFLNAALTVLLLEIGLLVEVISLVAPTDPWLVPCLATSLGAKSRMTAVVNMMQGHIAAAAPREVGIPADLVYSYAMNKYVDSCPDKMSWKKPLPPVKIINKNTQGSSKRVTDIKLEHDSSAKYVAWLGPWGSIRYSPIKDAGVVEVPTDLYGHVWAVLTTTEGVKPRDIYNVAVAGPEMMWVSEP
jgi:hypothetical protein